MSKKLIKNSPTTKGWDWQKNDDERWLIPSHEIHYLSSRWQNNQSRNFLDLGCGLGRHSIFMAQNGFQVSAFDISSYGLDILKNQAQKEDLRIDIQQGDMLKLPFPDHSFDCLLAYHVIHHTDTNGFKKTLSEIERVLKPGGEVYLTLLSKNSWPFVHRDPQRMIDKNTLLRDEIATERDVPHFFLALEELADIFENWQQLQVPTEIIEYYDNGKFSAHWHLLLKKTTP